MRTRSRRFEKGRTGVRSADRVGIRRARSPSGCPPPYARQLARGYEQPNTRREAQHAADPSADKTAITHPAAPSVSHPIRRSWMGYVVPAARTPDCRPERETRRLGL
jgi:hypothetical protein